MERLLISLDQARFRRTIDAWRQHERQRASRNNPSKGWTLLELVVTCSILLILSTLVTPLVRVTVKSRKEAILRYDLRQMRDGIDRYKDDADKNQVEVGAGTEGYPPDLETLVDGAHPVGMQEQHKRYLREIPTDPMTGKKDWGLRSVQDDPDSTGWGGQDVFDVYSQSTGTALDGTKYSDW